MYMYIIHLPSPSPKPPVSSSSKPNQETAAASPQALRSELATVPAYMPGRTEGECKSMRCWEFGWFVGWLIDWLVGWLVDLLVDCWLVGWLVLWFVWCAVHTNHGKCHFCTFWWITDLQFQMKRERSWGIYRIYTQKKNSHRYRTWPYSTGVPPIPRPIILGVQPFVFGGVYYLPAQYDRSLWPMRWFTRMYVCSQLRVLGNHSGHSASSMLV